MERKFQQLQSELINNSNPNEYQVSLIAIAISNRKISILDKVNVLENIVITFKKN